MLNVNLFLPPGVRWVELVRDWFMPMLAADRAKQTPMYANRSHAPVPPRYLPMRFQPLTDECDPGFATPYRLQGRRGAVVVLNYGLHQSKLIVDPRNSSAMAAATAQQADDFEEVTTAFLRSPSAAADGDASRLLLLETPPQHFATHPTGLHVPGSEDAPCAEQLEPSSTRRHDIANWRNVGMQRGMQRGMQQDRSGAGGARVEPDQNDRRVRIVRTWEALVRLGGPDCHHRHRAPVANRSALEQERIASGAHDCTHLSPDALLFVSQAVAAAIDAVRR